MRSLQDARLSVQTMERISRDPSVTPPSADKESAVSCASSSQNQSSSHSRTSSQSQMPVTSTHPTGSSGHSFISPSSLGLPSPSSSTASSPHLSLFTLSEFNLPFPSIGELDEDASIRFLELPSVPTSKPGTSNPSAASPSESQRFPSFLLDLDHGLRPASTPVPTTLYPQGRPPPPPRGLFSGTRFCPLFLRNLLTSLLRAGRLLVCLLVKVHQ